jgi:hypothetical protein
MNPSDYRRDYADYRSRVERARFEHHAGLSARVELRPAEERYADLWMRDSFEALRRAFEETPTQFETERAALRALAGAATTGHVERAAHEVSEELRRCEESAGFDWKGARISAAGATRLSSAERDAAMRRELTRRRLDSLRACEDLRAERLEALGGAARSLGYGGRAALYESFTGASLESLAASAEGFLRRTEGAYMSRLAEWAARGLRAAEAGAPEYADLSQLERAPVPELRLAARDFPPLYTATLAGLGAGVESRPNLHMDDAARPGKGEETACFAVRPPEDVRLVVGAAAGGLDFQRRSFREGGRAQMFAWASRETSRRYPEFVYAPDVAVERGHGLLFAGLFRDPSWLAGRTGLRAAVAEEAARASALADLCGARRECASLAYALALDRAGDVRSERLSEEYSTLFTDATGFRHDPASRLLDADEWFASASNLRARLFAASLREHLRARHGRRWFDSRGAGEELVDVWNTASRYQAEELARLAWGGELSFDLLADELVAALKPGEGV